jgi:Zn-dependent peptidase ImmA (M78 family)/DNA-binding XRE family transcriptional regulator
MFNPIRLKLARKRRGISKVDLADKYGISLRTLTSHENGEKEPSVEALESYAQALKFPVEFFYGDDLEEFHESTASFRSLSRMTASERDCALAAGALAVHLAKWIEAKFMLPEVSVPDLRDESPEVVANTLRLMWNLGERPIKNMVHLLEQKGIRVFSLPTSSLNVDAFSGWNGDIPYVFLSTNKSGERGRFDAAHELGHLVMHRHATLQKREVEIEANQFASAFLMPRGSVLAAGYPSVISSNALVKLKRSWNVSVFALAYRLQELQVLSEWRYRSLCVEMTQLGYRKTEPQSIQRESSQLLDKVFTALRSEGITRAAVARQLQINADELESLIFGLVISSISGGLKSKSSKTQVARGNLRLMS